MMILFRVGSKIAKEARLKPKPKIASFCNKECGSDPLLSQLDHGESELLRPLRHLDLVGHVPVATSHR